MPADLVVRVFFSRRPDLISPHQDGGEQGWLRGSPALLHYGRPPILRFGLLHASSCSQPRAAFKGAMALPRSVFRHSGPAQASSSYVSPCCGIATCFSAQGSFCGALSFVDCPDLHGCSEAGQKCPQEATGGSRGAPQCGVRPAVRPRAPPRAPHLRHPRPFLGLLPETLGRHSHWDSQYGFLLRTLVGSILETLSRDSHGDSCAYRPVTICAYIYIHTHTYIYIYIYIGALGPRSFGQRP